MCLTLFPHWIINCLWNNFTKNSVSAAEWIGESSSGLVSKLLQFSEPTSKTVGWITSNADPHPSKATFKPSATHQRKDIISELCSCRLLSLWTEMWPITLLISISHITWPFDLVRREVVGGLLSLIHMDDRGDGLHCTSAPHQAPTAVTRRWPATADRPARTWYLQNSFDALIQSL